MLGGLAYMEYLATTDRNIMTLVGMQGKPPSYNHTITTTFIAVTRLT
jgi:hypothetical protein